MTRTDALLILCAIALTFAGVVDSPFYSPLLIVLGGSLGVWGWKRKDREELLRLFA